MNTRLNHILQSQFKLTPSADIYLFKSGYCNIYLLVQEGHGLLIDAGKEGKETEFLDFLGSKGLNENDLRHIVLTHTHNDHTGALKGIAEATGASVYVHANEAEPLRSGYTPAPLGTRFFPKVISLLGRKVAPSVMKYPAVEPDLILDKEQPEALASRNLTWLHTPGHTVGSVTYILDGKVAFPGDILFGMSKTDCYPWFADNPRELKHSWKKLLESDIQVFLPAHGKPVTREVLEHSFRKHFG